MQTLSGIYKCDKCGNFSTSDPEEMLTHLTFHEHISSAFIPLVHVKVYKCDKCEANFATLGACSTHQLKHIMETYNDYEADSQNTSKEDHDKASNKNIVNTSKENRDYKSKTKRNYKFKLSRQKKSKINRANISRKIKAIDTSNRRFECNICNTSYVLESTLKIHSMKHRPHPYKCQCGINYYRQIDYQGHLRVVHAMRSLISE